MECTGRTGEGQTYLAVAMGPDADGVPRTVMRLPRPVSRFTMRYVRWTRRRPSEFRDPPMNRVHIAFFLAALAGAVCAGRLAAQGFTPEEAVKTHEGRRRLRGQTRRLGTGHPPAGDDDLRRPRPDVGHSISAISHSRRTQGGQGGSVLRTVYDRMPEPPPKGPKGADRITILEDPDANGRYRKAKDFVDRTEPGVRLCLGYGGVYVLQTPYLLFYPDRDGDDVPDGDRKCC